ncbi:hypothetical protein ALO73_200164 [Pseudomonas syringae pv. daphniphylli]|uniref:Cupin n=2 Tax=Pseudomonas syringae TaxID=317 RepID=A0A9X0H455_PSESX|nr:hypothetical protein ALO73_200164 [Pseudomonas syringae pv. daphniphylli]
MTRNPAKTALSFALWLFFCLLFGSAAFAEGPDGVTSGSPERAVRSQSPGSPMKIRITANGKSILATLADNSSARDFTSLLPITLNMHDLFEREKAAALPRPISTDGPRSSSYAVGEVILWSPGPDIAVFYRHDGKTIPAPGSILIATVDVGVEMFDTPGRVKVTVELADD